MVRGFLAGTIAACLAGAEVLAGAWPLPEGDGQIIVTSSRKIAPASGFLGGEVKDDTNAFSIFAEYGATSELTVGLTAYGEFSTTIADDYEARVGAHARYQFWAGEAGDVASVQLGIGLPVERWLGNGLGDFRPESVPEFRFGVLYGKGWQTNWGNSFVSSEVALLIRGEGKDEELKFDVTVGHEPFRGVLGLMSIFATQPLGASGDVGLKLSPSIAFTMWPWLGSNDKKPTGPLNPNTVQIGLTWDAANPGDGLTASVGVWKRF